MTKKIDPDVLALKQAKKALQKSSSENMNNNIREITEKALSGLVGIIAGVVIFFCFIYPLILKIARIYNGQE